MEKYNCENCVYCGKGGVFNRNKKCDSCLVEVKNHVIVGKPTNFKSIEEVKDNDKFKKY